MSRRGLSRASVISAAGDLADSDGLEHLTLARLAAELGVRSPSLYNHVDGLGDVRAGVAASALREVHAAVLSAVAGRSGEEAVRAAAGAYRRYALDHPGRYAAMQRPPADGSEQAAPADELVQLFARLLEPWQLSEEDTIHAIRALRSAIHGFVELERLGGFGIDLSTGRSYDRLMQILIAGFGPVPAAAGSGTRGP
ncbi:MAG TPA: WHG domain-containing protein [Gaiellales bacterium]|nr:WHG domain-containing protein [Gaiellales bacterium]